MTISIIIPTYNEAECIGKLIQYLCDHSDSSVVDIIVTDGGSEDDTIAIAKGYGVSSVASPVRGRAAQMNYGAGIATGDVFYFIHADSFPAADFIKDINQSIKDGYDMGRYRTKFDSDRTILKINAWFTRFDLFICMGGDQTLFIKKGLFKQCNGFNGAMKIMEDYEFCVRARQAGNYKIMKGAALISARKYDKNSWLKVQLANYKIVRMYKTGASQQQRVDSYQALINSKKEP